MFIRVFQPKKISVCCNLLFLAKHPKVNCQIAERLVNWKLPILVKFYQHLLMKLITFHPWTDFWLMSNCSKNDQFFSFFVCFVCTFTMTKEVISSSIQVCMQLRQLSIKSYLNIKNKMATLPPDIHSNITIFRKRSQKHYFDFIFRCNIKFRINNYIK